MLGLNCEIGAAGCTHQVPYIVVVPGGSVRWRWSPAMLSLYRRMEEQIEQGFEAAGVPAYS
jgi:hypothetical protein